MKSSLVEPLAALRKGQHEDDLQDGGRDGEHVRVEYGESKVAKCEA
jgi:hypothetical protein